ncbi:Sterol O-acyltransferase 2 (Sterol-ester synthase 2), partial [Nowakowskiella sp. JEL0078]
MNSHENGISRFVNNLFSTLFRYQFSKVHEFLLRHVYLESVHSLKLSKNNATLVTFFLSSIFHELVFAVIGKR